MVEIGTVDDQFSRHGDSGLVPGDRGAEPDVSRPRVSQTLDDIDVQILVFLQDNARISNAEIARRVGMAPSAIHERIRKLEERGVIRGYEARIEPGEVDINLLAFVFVNRTCGTECEPTEHQLAEIPGVQEVHVVAGDYCFLVKVRAPSMAALHEVINDRIPSIPTVDSTKTVVVLKTAKETSRLPLEPRIPVDIVEA